MTFFDYKFDFVFDEILIFDHATKMHTQTKTTKCENKRALSWGCCKCFIIVAPHDSAFLLSTNQHGQDFEIISRNLLCEY